MRTAPDRISGSARGKPARLGAAGLAIAVLMGLPACSGDDDDTSPGPSTGESRATEEVTTDAALGKLHGRLGPQARSRVVADVTAVVDDWSGEAFGGEYPRTDFAGAFAAFTPDARALALRQSALLSNAEVGGDLEAATISSRVVRVDVAAPGGKLAGATARFRIVVDLVAGDGGTDRQEVVSGRLLLTPAAKGWRVFGFDVRRGETGEGS